MASQGRPVRRTTKAVWINSICLFVAVSLSLVAWEMYDVDQAAGRGFGFFAGVAILSAIAQECAVRKQIRLMRFGEVGTAKITWAWDFWLRHEYHFRIYTFYTPDGREVRKFKMIKPLDAICMIVGYEVEVVYDPRRPRCVMFSQDIWAAALIESEPAR